MSLPLSLSTPNMALLLSYIECLREGSFETMQLNFASATAEDIEANPEGYIKRLTDPAPFSYPFRGKNYEITKHELLWLHVGPRFIGTIALRYDGDQDLLLNWVGHIGAAVRPGLLQKGYGIRGLKQSAQLIKERFLHHNLSSIRISCDPANKASRRLISFFGAKIIREDIDWLLFEAQISS